MNKNFIKIKKSVKKNIQKEKTNKLAVKKAEKKLILKKNDSIKSLKQKGNSDIKKFIDFFFDAVQKIKKIKPEITHGKDGFLTKLALNKLSLSQLEQLALWFLIKKQGLSLTIGAMLSYKVLDSLKRDMERHDFFKEIDMIYAQYFRNTATGDFAKKLENKFKPFNSIQITEMQEQIARLEHLVKRGIY